MINKYLTSMRLLILCRNIPTKVWLACCITKMYFYDVDHILSLKRLIYRHKTKSMTSKSITAV